VTCLTDGKRAIWMVFALLVVKREFVLHKIHVDLICLSLKHQHSWNIC